MTKATITNIQTTGINLTFTVEIENDVTGERVKENFNMEASRFKDMDSAKTGDYIKNIIQGLIQTRIDSLLELDEKTGQWKKADLFLNKEFTF